jgi:hypothetical protein
MTEWFKLTSLEQSLHARVRSVGQRMHTDYQRQHGIFYSHERTRIPLQESGWSYYPGLRKCSGNWVEWRRNPSHDSSWPFYSHVPGLTLVTHGTACIPPTRITLVQPPLAKNLG